VKGPDLKGMKALLLYCKNAARSPPEMQRSPCYFNVIIPTDANVH